MRRTLAITTAILGSAAILWRAIGSPLPSLGAAAVFSDAFENAAEIEEVAAPESSAHAEWWLNSGGKFVIAGGVGSTLTGARQPDDPWRKRYAASNPVDTDGGRYPQNVFRLLTRKRWRDADERVYFRIRGTSASPSPERNESNGVFLLARYQPGGGLFYSLGLRVDGVAVIKRKGEGGYRTLASRSFAAGPAYHRSLHPNLLADGQWFGIRSVARDLPDGAVLLQLFIDPGRTGAWTLAAEARDPLGRNAIRDAGAGGIRTDFMDVEFDDYEVSEIR